VNTPSWVLHGELQSLFLGSVELTDVVASINGTNRTSSMYWSGTIQGYEASSASNGTTRRNKTKNKKQKILKNSKISQAKPLLHSTQLMVSLLYQQHCTSAQSTWILISPLHTPQQHRTLVQIILNQFSIHQAPSL
jgi:hypothetical protein